MSPDPSGSDAPDERRFNEKLDDLQAARPFVYNLVVGLVVGLLGLLFGFHWIVIPIYGFSYAAMRAYLWGEGRVLRRQYDARKVRSNDKRDERRRQR